MAPEFYMRKYLQLLPVISPFRCQNFAADWMISTAAVAQAETEGFYERSQPLLDLDPIASKERVATDTNC